jgi:transcriptional regulator with XRE-family HTH domain
MAHGESVKQVAEAVGLTRAMLNAYELGRRAVPITHIEKLIGHYGLRIDELLDLGIGQIGQAQLLAKQHAEFDGLPDDVKDFAGTSANLPYLQLAMHLSRMPKERLRAAAEVLGAVSDSFAEPDDGA